MDNERWKEIERLYHAATEIKSDERKKFLQKACEADPSLRSEVESLLLQDELHGSSFDRKPPYATWAHMNLSSGNRIGPYEIKSLLGEGGMGIVYRAHDTKLGRDVAIKTLPDAFTSDEDRIQRFQREAHVLASLNHPNIAQIYGLEESEDMRCIVMELVEGETLQERLKRGPIPVEEALPIAKQIAEAFEAAHESGLVHRDLKPANIKLTADGRVKVLDFGLAKAFSPMTAAIDLSNSPSMLSGSMPGVILGTAAYMAPEQAKGKTVDRRADIWAFGVVLYEMLTGRMLFSGETASETIAAVMTKEPDWTALPANTPARVLGLLRRCLTTEPRNRLRDIGEARIAIEAVQSGAENDVLQTPRRRASKVRVGISAVFLLTTVLSLAALAVVYFKRATPPELRVEVTTPSTDDPVSLAISPDGRRLVFSASNEGKIQLWVRPLDSVAAQPLTGTEGASYPFWSADSASVGFFADGKLKRIDIVGGAQQVLSDAAAGRGGAWNRHGTIVFATSPSGPLLKVSATGGEAAAITRLEAGQGGHKFPQFLPDSKHFVYFVQGGPAQGIYVGSLDGDSPKRLANADAAGVVSPSGFLLFPRQTTLFAQTFDFKKQELSGNPFSVAEQVAFDATTSAGGFSATSGIVAFRTGSASGARQLTWLDRSGKIVGTVGTPDIALLWDVELSPDGKRVAVNRTVNGNEDVWLIDAERGAPTRFTFDAASDQKPVWSPDGHHVVFHSNRRGMYKLYRKLSGGAGTDELLLESDRNIAPTDWSSDGRFLLFRTNHLQTGYDLWVLPIAGDKKPFPLLKTPFEERDGQFSPDGKWIAYQSNESGRFEIYVQPFPGLGGKFQISTNGGTQARWNKNGSEIFYVSLDSKMMAAPVRASRDGHSLETGNPSALFPVRLAGGPLPGPNRQQYAVSSDGQRFLVNLAVDQSAASPITLIYNWKPKP